MGIGASVLIIVLVMLVFGSSQVIELVIKKRREKRGENIIQDPWQQIHDIPGYRNSRNIAAFYPLKGEANIMPIVEELALEVLLADLEGGFELDVVR